MNKLFKSLLTLTTVAAISIPTMATNTETLENGKSKDITVTGNYDVMIHTEQIYNAQVSWGSFHFEYLESGDRIWDPSTHEYDDSNVTGEFIKQEDNQVTVTNHSNADLDVAFGYTSLVDGVTGTFTYDKEGVVGDSLTLAMGEYNNPNGADSVTATLTLDGQFKGDTTELNKMGTIKVSIKANENVNTTQHGESGVYGESEIIKPIIAE